MRHGSMSSGGSRQHHHETWKFCHTTGKALVRKLQNNATRVSICTPFFICCSMLCSTNFQLQAGRCVAFLVILQMFMVSRGGWSHLVDGLACDLEVAAIGHLHKHGRVGEEVEHERVPDAGQQHAPVRPVQHRARHILALHSHHLAPPGLHAHHVWVPPSLVVHWPERARHHKIWIYYQSTSKVCIEALQYNNIS